MLWVIADTVLSILGKGLPGRRRSLDPAFRSVATERGQQATAQVSLDKLLDEKKSLEAERDKTLADLESKFTSPSNCRSKSSSLKPRKADIEVDRVSLVWLPYRLDTHGAAEPVYQLPNADCLTSENCPPTSDPPASLPQPMTERERWIVYPLLFLALGAALRDKLSEHTKTQAASSARS